MEALDERDDSVGAEKRIRCITHSFAQRPGDFSVAALPHVGTLIECPVGIGDQCIDVSELSEL